LKDVGVGIEGGPDEDDASGDFASWEPFESGSFWPGLCRHQDQDIECESHNKGAAPNRRPALRVEFDFISIVLSAPHHRCPAVGDRSATLRFMKIQTISTIMAVTILLAGCGKQNTSSGTSPSSAKEQTGTAASAAPVAQAAMSAWQQGDKSTAVSKFLDADWSARPLFPPDSPLSLTEAQFQLLSNTDRQAKSNEMLPQVSALKALAAAVAQAGRDAASKGDAAQAQQCFASLKQCGTALSSPDCLSLVQLVGKAFNKMADTELAKLGK
jgi:hypothetical protein